MGILRKQFDRSYFEGIGHRELANSQRNRSRLRELSCYREGGKLLEIGCGKGGFLELAARDYDVSGIDISEYAVNTIQPTLGDRVRRVDVEDVGFPSAHYDVVAAFNILEHLEHPASVIAKIYNSLRDGGILIGSVPNNSAVIGSVFTGLTNLLDSTHCSTYAPDYWRTVFEEAGFRETIFFGEVTLGRNSSLFVKSSMWKHVSFNLMFIGEKQEYRSGASRSVNSESSCAVVIRKS
jgi:SAM-dependent methyltransferase